MAQAFTKEAMAARREELTKARASLTAKSDPLRKQREDVRAKLAPLEAQLRDISAKINAVERPALGEIDNELAAIARALGARSLAAH
jgi:uncharacterized coiled-coil DUF342 family protein